MHGMTLAITAFAVGLLALVNGVTSLARKQVALPWVRPRVKWQSYGWAHVFLGIFSVLETVPRLANGTDKLVLALSLVALAPLAGAITLHTRTRLLR